MKKTLLLLLATLVSMSSWAWVGDEFTVDGMIYTVTSENPNEVQISGPEGSCSTITGALVIPASVSDGGTVYAVTSIGKEAFACCYDLTSLTISEGIREIGNSAFYTCDALTSVTIAESVTTIGNKAFQDCWGLRAINIPAGVEIIGASAFENASNMTSITFAEGSRIRSIGNNAFKDTQWMGNQPNGLVYLDKVLLGFKGYVEDETEESLVIADGTMLIADYALRGTWWTKSIIIPASVKYIGNNAFENCELTSFTIPVGVTSIGDYAFAGCWGMTSINIPAGVTSIGKWAFYQSGLTSVTIPASVTSLGSNAFREIQSLTSVSFAKGSQLKEIPSMAFCDCPALISVNIPSSVTSIEQYAFTNCSSLTSITIPNGVTTIRSSFGGCSSLSDVYCYADPAVLNWKGYDRDFKDNKETLFHVYDVAAWKRFMSSKPSANVTFVGDLNPMLFAITDAMSVDVTDLDSESLKDTYIDNIYYNLDESLGCGVIDGNLVIGQPTDMSKIGSGEPSSEEVRNNFNGIIMKVIGSGTIIIDARILSNRTKLAVRIGDGAPTYPVVNGRSQVSVGYNVDNDTYVYIYAVPSDALVPDRKAPEVGDNAVVIYGITISPVATAIDTAVTNSRTSNVIYNLRGQRMDGMQRGLNIVDGRKVFIR